MVNLTKIPRLRDFSYNLNSAPHFILNSYISMKNNEITSELVDKLIIAKHS